MPGSRRAATKELQWQSLDWRHGRHLTLLGIGAADGGSRDMVGAEMQCRTLSCDGEWLVTGVRCHMNIWMAMWPGMLTRLSENKNTGCFNSKVLRRQYAEIWEEPGKVQYLYCSCRGNISHPYTQINQTSINGEQLSPESAKSKSFELKTNDIAISLIQNCVIYMHTTSVLKSSRRTGKKTKTRPNWTDLWLDHQSGFCLFWKLSVRFFQLWKFQ